MSLSPRARRIVVSSSAIQGRISPCPPIARKNARFPVKRRRKSRLRSKSVARPWESRARQRRFRSIRSSGPDPRRSEALAHGAAIRPAGLPDRSSRSGRGSVETEIRDDLLRRIADLRLRMNAIPSPRRAWAIVRSVPDRDRLLEPQVLALGQLAGAPPPRRRRSCPRPAPSACLLRSPARSRRRRCRDAAGGDVQRKPAGEDRRPVVEGRSVASDVQPPAWSGDAVRSPPTPSSTFRRVTTLETLRKIELPVHGDLGDLRNLLAPAAAASSSTPRPGSAWSPCRRPRVGGCVGRRRRPGTRCRRRAPARVPGDRPEAPRASIAPVSSTPKGHGVLSSSETRRIDVCCRCSARDRSRPGRAPRDASPSAGCRSASGMPRLSCALTHRSYSSDRRA